MEWNPQERYKKCWEDDSDYPKKRVLEAEKGEVVTAPISGKQYKVRDDGAWVRVE